MSFLLVIFVLAVSSKLAPLHLERSEKTIKDQYIVVFKNEITPSVYQNQINLAKAGLKVGHTYEHTLKGFSAELDADQLLKLRSNPFVDFIEGDQVVSLAECTKQVAESWGLTRIAERELNLEDGKYFASAKQGTGVNAYVLDTGVLLAHNEFKLGRATFGFKAESTWSDTDRNGHGTHVASTIAGKLYGVAKNAQIIAVKVLGDNGSGSWSGVIAGIDYVAQQHKQGTKPSVANLSIGGSKSSAINTAVNNAVQAGVVMVVAAGNEDDDACNYSPASATGAITVGATDTGIRTGQNMIDIRSSFSNYGRCVDIFAPGSDITGAWYTSDVSTNIISGTSMASPHVCGAAALLLGDSPSMTAAQVRERILANANSGQIDLLCGTTRDCETSPNRLLFNGCSAPTRTI